MVQKIICVIISFVLLFSLFANSVFAKDVDTPNWRADAIYKMVVMPPSGSSQIPVYGYKYDGSIKGADNAMDVNDVAYAYISLWDVFDTSADPIYFDDFYTYTVKIRLNTEDGVAYFEQNGDYLNNLDIMIGSSVSLYEMYGTTDPDEVFPEDGWAHPKHATAGGYWIYLSDFFENIAVGTTTIDRQTLEITVVFSTPARTYEHQWDMINIHMEDIYYEWADDTSDEWIYFTDFTVQYDKDLSEYESAVQEGLTEIGNKVDDLNNTIQQGNQQAHQDAEDIKDAINNQNEQEKNEANSGGNANIGSGQEALKDFNVDNLLEGVQMLYEALCYHGTDATWTLPGSGNVPLLNAVLWEEQDINLLPTQLVENSIFKALTVCTNFIVILGTGYTCLWCFNDLLTTFNGKGGEDNE